MNKQFYCGRYRLPIGEKTYIMGILNVTPDSFSDGGRFFSPDAAVRHALEMQQAGADLIDIGAQSTRPGYTPISPQEEWDRLEPVLRALDGVLSVPVSVDTFFPQVAEKALALGVDAINDVTGFANPDMWRVAAESACGCIVMHCREAQEILPDIRAFFAEVLERAKQYGIPANRICFDPGIGFGKTYEQNLEILANTDQIKNPACMFLMAASRKRVIGQPCGNPPFEQRMPGTIAAHTIAQVLGADMLRVHDVPQAVQAARVADAIFGARHKEERNG